MLYHAREATLQLSDLQLDYLTFGRGPKPLVMIQGLNTRNIRGAALPLAYMYRMFTKDYTVYIFDRRRNVQPGVTVRDLAADVAKAMDALGLSGAYVMGVSQGGMIAQYLAIDRPDLVGKLALAVTLSRNNETVQRVVSDWISMTERGAMQALVADMAEKMYSPAYVRRYRPFLPLLTLLQKPRDVQRFLTLARACLTCSTYDELGSIRCPVLVLGGRQDQVVTGIASEEIAAKLGCPIRMYDHLGHAAYEEARDFNQTVYDFFAGRMASC